MKRCLFTVSCLSFVLCAVAMVSPSNAQAKTKPAAAPRAENARESQITGKYLLFPVSNNAAKGRRGRLSITVDGQLVHSLDCDFPANKESIAWWTYLDMAEYKGKTAKVTTITA